MSENSYLASIFGKKNYTAQTSIQSKSIGTIADETFQARCPWRNCYTARNGSLNGTLRPKVWKEVDTFSNATLGFGVKYDTSYSYGRGKEATVKSLNRYSSRLANQKIKLTKSDFSEADIIKGVEKIAEDCNFGETTLTSADSIKKVCHNLTLDASSPLKSLKGLEEVGGKLSVVAKNREEMVNYLKQLGIMSKTGDIIPTIKEGIRFIMKSYI